MTSVEARRRQGFSATELIFVCLILVVLLGVARQAYSSYQDRALVRLCHDQQRRLQRGIGGLGVSNLDVDLQPLLARVDSEFSTGRTLIDPGFDKGSGDHYVMMAGSLKLGCTIHGSPFLGSGPN